MSDKKITPRPVPKSTPPNDNYRDIADKRSKADTQEPCWIFSFQYYKRIEHFCFGHEKFSDSWMATLFDRLSQLSKIKVKDIVEGSAQSKSEWKWHKVNWSSKNVPLSRSDLNWVPDGIPEEEFYQIRIHDGAGRLIGFMVKDIFNIVLIDSMHNMQPAKRVQHKIRAADLIECRFDKLEHKFLTIKKRIDSLSPDELIRAVKEVMENEMLADFSAKVIEICPSFHTDIDKIMKDNSLDSYAEAVEHALAEYIYQKSS